MKFRAPLNLRFSVYPLIAQQYSSKSKIVNRKLKIQTSLMSSRTFTIFLLLISINTNAQLLPFKKYTAKDGLNSKLVYSTIRDDRGLLWVGTAFGINWFDGSKFYQPPVPKKVDQLFVDNFYKDKEGTIWTLTFYNGLYKFQNDKFTNFLIDSSYSDINKNNVFEMLEISPGKYLVGTDGTVFLFDGKHFTEFDPSNPGLRMQVHTLAQLPGGTTLIGYKGVFAYKFQNNKWELINNFLKGIEVNKIISANGHTWIATNRGLYFYERFDAEKDTAPTKIYLQDKTIFYCSLDNKGDVWASASDASYKISGTEVTRFTSENGLNSRPQQTYTDDQNITWISSFDGLYKLGQVYYTYRKFQPENLNEILSLVRDGDNAVWAGYNNGYGNIDKKTFYSFPAANGMEAGGTTLYYAPVSKKLWALNKLGVFEIVNNIPKKKFSIPASIFYEDATGKDWIATDDDRLFQINGSTLQKIVYPHFQRDFISSICSNGKGFIWLGFRYGGICKCKIKDSVLEKISEFSSATGFPDMRIRSSIVDRYGNIIFGTRTNGLFIFLFANDSNPLHVNSNAGLNASWVKNIAADEKNIYLGTNNSLVVIKQEKNYDHLSLHTVNFSDESITKETSGVLAKDGHVLLAVNGIVDYFPDKDAPDTASPPVYFTNLGVIGKTDSSLQPYTTQKGTMDLPYSKNIVSFEFAAIHLQDEYPLHYRYRLEGQDADWIATDRNFVSYHLPPGHYAFNVEAQNGNGSWSRQPARYQFTIRQPFWSTWWFITLIAITTAAAVYAIYRYRMQQLLKLERLRSKISTDLHDEIGSTLSSISILSDIALRTDQHQDMMEEIKENSLALMDKMDDIVWSINPKNDSLENLLIRIKRFSSKLFEAKDIDYTIEIDRNISDIRLPMENRQHIYMILKEAINNLVKYSDCTKAIIRVRHLHSTLQIDIIDNGKGFDATLTGTGNGLINMQTRSRSMNAGLKIDSVKGEGTAIQLKTKIK
jgi:signal transduction histidine kinase/ligand-binding sensor domain-containing protein